MIILEENSQIKQLNEMLISSLPSLPAKVENSIYYTKLRQLLHGEIVNFCREHIGMKEDLNMLRMSVGQPMTETEIRDYLDGLKEKYNNTKNNIGIDYHIEVTRIDYGVPVFVVIKRDQIYMKKFVFRFRKLDQSDGIDELSMTQIEDSSKEKRKEKVQKLLGGE